METDNQTKELFKDYNDVVTIEEIMKMLHIGRSSVYELLQNGKLYSVKIGKKYIVTKQSVINFIQIK